MAMRLGLGALRHVPVESRPRVRPGTVPAGIVHLGLGAFHRAHQAVYTEAAVAEAGGDWGIVGVAPRSTEVVGRLAEQDNLFSVTSLSNDEARTHVVGALAGVRHAASDPMAVVALRPDPAVAADLVGDGPPATVPGLLVRGLIARARAGAGPVALVSCDNLPSNGKRLHGLVTQALAYGGTEEALVEWVRASVTFPGTMVDRIVPATTAETLATAERVLGVSDQAAVAAEPYLQWVIEDDFPGGRPAWERAGAVLTGDASPWERLKLRALNGVHSAIAYLGALAGREMIAEALEIPGMVTMLRRFVAEDVAGSLVPPDGVSVVEYGDSVLERFANAAIRHRTIQVAMDGSQKLPQRVLHTLLDRRAAGASPRWGALVLAAWMRFVQGESDAGQPLPLDDPLAERIRKALSAGKSTPEGVVDALFGLTEVFPAELAADDTMRELVAGWLGALERHGVESVLVDLR
jgi:fructuronate reductase